MIFSDLHKKTWGYCWHLLRAKSCAYEAKKTSWAAFRGTLPAGWSRWSFLSPQHWWGHTWGSVSSSALFTERDTQTYQKESSKWPQISLKDWIHHPLRKGWESWDCSAWWREAWGGLSNVYKNVRKGYKDRDRLLSVVLSNMIRGNGYRLNYGRNHMNIRKRLLFPSLEILKNGLNILSSNLLQVALLEKRCWTKWPPEIPFDSNHSLILWFCSLKWHTMMHQSENNKAFANLTIWLSIFFILIIKAWDIYIYMYIVFLYVSLYLH